jgi:hypothetical protein
MKKIQSILVLLIFGTLLSSCSLLEDDLNNEVVLDELLSRYDLWYVDIHNTNGNGTVPFIEKAFTVSFYKGGMFANNNIVDIGITGNGFGISVGNYSTKYGVLQIDNTLDGLYDFEVYQVSENEIRIENRNNGVSYLLVGYQRDHFNYDKLFYENIEYFLQEYIAWEKGSTSVSGAVNPFDEETFLQFTPENNTTFYASKDLFGTNIDVINWDFTGSYQIFDVQDYEDLKILTLNYENGDNEEFELSVINDSKISLYHMSSETTYQFNGKGFVQYLKSENSKPNVRNSGRIRTKIERETRNRRDLK